MDELTPEGRFQYCVDVILEHEGGLSRDKADPGGITQWGVSLRFLRQIGFDIDGDGDIDANDVLALTQDGAKDIYRNQWWEKYHYNAFNELPVCAKVFDLSVNMGPSSAHKVLQTAINRLRHRDIAVDGVLGGITFAAANSLDGNTLRQELRQCAKEKYLRILEAKPALECFRRGWLNRAAW